MLGRRIFVGLVVIPLLISAGCGAQSRQTVPNSPTKSIDTPSTTLPPTSGTPDQGKPEESQALEMKTGTLEIAPDVQATYVLLEERSSRGGALGPGGALTIKDSTGEVLLEANPSLDDLGPERLLLDQLVSGFAMCLQPWPRLSASLFTRGRRSSVKRPSEGSLGALWSGWVSGIRAFRRSVYIRGSLECKETKPRLAWRPLSTIGAVPNLLGRPLPYH